jgi:hypothetical protein
MLAITPQPPVLVGAQEQKFKPEENPERFLEATRS